MQEISLLAFNQENAGNFSLRRYGQCPQECKNVDRQWDSPKGCARTL